MPMPSGHATRCAVVLVGHGAPATDCPPRLVGELMALEWRAGGATRAEPAGRSPERARGQRPRRESKGQEPDAQHVDARIAELDTAIRNWPRTTANDPYKTGLERLAQTLQPLLPTDLFTVAYNEFCRPSIEDAIAQVVGQGAARILVLPTMMTPGGLHSERDIPTALDAARRRHPQVMIEYLWPFRLERVAALLAEHIRQAVGPAACA